MKIGYNKVFGYYIEVTNSHREKAPLTWTRKQTTTNSERYITIELKDLLIPDPMKNKFENWMFGCDICQDVCPWNRFSKPTLDPAFTPVAEILHYNEKDWEEVTEEGFKKIFAASPLKRAKYQGIRRNLHFIRKVNG